MLMELKTLFLLASILTLSVLAGCAAPCESYCDATATYIGYCLENGSQGEWVAADWSHWGDFSGEEDFVAHCTADLEAQLASGNAEVVEANCTDKTNSYTEMSARGLCADLP